MLNFNDRLEEFTSSLTNFQIQNFLGNHIEKNEGINQAVNIIKDVIRKDKNVFIIGNGGSAGIASHAANDFINMCGLKCITFHDISVITCMTNDYGYDVTYQKLVENFSRDEDCLVAISSSGNSSNIINAINKFKEQNPHGKTITLSGFSDNNKLRNKGDLNFWVDSKSYGIVEIAHQFILHFLADKIYKDKS